MQEALHAGVSGALPPGPGPLHGAPSATRYTPTYYSDRTGFKGDVVLPAPAEMQTYDVARAAWAEAYPDMVWPDTSRMGTVNLDAPLDPSIGAGTVGDRSAAGALFSDSGVPDAPYYDPRSALLRAPVGKFGLGGQYALPTSAHGPSLFAYDMETDGRPRTVLDASTPTVIEPLVFTGCTRCITPRLTPYSLAAELLSPRNAFRVRKLLVKSGLVRLTPAASKQTFRNTQACGLLESAFLPFLEFASQYEDQPMFNIETPLPLLKRLNQQFVDNIHNALLTSVRQTAFFKYALEAGNAAGLQPDPVAKSEADAWANAHMWPDKPTVLPSGKVVETTGFPTAFGRVAADHSLAGVPQETIDRMYAILAGKK